MTDYKLILEQVKGFAREEPWYVPLFSNVSALLFEELKDINWVGFYIMKNGSLVVGPFQGKVACIRIPVGKGVCGTSVERDEVLLVPDVHAFPGHIACDGASRSEIVLPIHIGGRIMGVLDIDSPIENRFSEADEKGLRAIVEVLEENATMLNEEPT